ncbi:MAG: PhoH family protein [Magnetococcales bacterium]|nr:PhoH family protein [Magnetococcales bacterium]NGZ07422.1 PhoH family protein [Magnetococcales bacterium]
MPTHGAIVEEERVEGELHGITLTFPENRLAVALYGPLDLHLRHVEERTGVEIHSVGNRVTLMAPSARVESVKQLFLLLYAALEQGQEVDLARVEAGMRLLELPEGDVDRVTPELVMRTPLREIRARTPRQSEYLRALQRETVVFAIGPAGTGKTYLAVAAAVLDFIEGRTARIILTRPAVEAGEKLGFLPGDLQEKVDPYLRPLYDALYEMLGYEKVERMLSRNLLEIAPLAYMRGRTLTEASIILDEAQNTTVEQMKMFLTRLGEGSRVVVSGDITQVDLPTHQRSGLAHAVEVLAKVEGISFVWFNHRDVVRHPMVRRIVQAYEEAAAREYSVAPDRCVPTGRQHHLTFHSKRGGHGS